MKLFLIVAFALALQAEDAKPTTIEQLNAQIAEQQQTIVEMQFKIDTYRKIAYSCQEQAADAQIDAQSKAKGKPKPQATK